jgi:hypothetical protein
VDDWWRERHHPSVPNKPGRPALLCESEVLTLAILSQWPRFRSERDFWRFACSHLRPSIFYIVRSGCAWRHLPHPFLPWRTIHHHYFRTWRIDGTWERMHEKPCASVCGSA